MSESNEMRLWKYVREKLSAGLPVALACVTADEKGSPGKRGFKMALATDDSFSGTIGGGIMEHSLRRQVAERLARDGDRIAEVRLLVHVPQAQRGEPSGLSCAGSETVAIVSLSERDMHTVESIVDAINDRRPAHCIVTPRGLTIEAGRLPVHAIFEQASAQEWTYSENIGAELTIFIVGGGHVGCALSRVASTLPVTVVLYDERKDLPMFAENEYAHRKISDAYANVGLYLADPERTFAAVVTSDFSTDAVAVRQLLPLHLPYLGIMGVPAKMARIKSMLTDEERAAFELQSVHAPIGLAIGSSTAEEIAVSIAAEMIAVKNKKER